MWPGLMEQPAQAHGGREHDVLRNRKEAVFISQDT